MNSKIGVRQSNFELLRIIVMVMIAVSHTQLIPTEIAWSGGGNICI